MIIHRKWTEASRQQRMRLCIRLSSGLVTALVGAFSMLSAIVPRSIWLVLFGPWSMTPHPGMQKLTVVVGFLLIMLSSGLARGKYQAWCATVLLLLMSALLRVLFGGTVLATLIVFSLLAALVFLSRAFQAKSDPPSVRRGYAALLVGVSIVVLYSIGGMIALYDQFEPLFDRFGIDGVIIRLLANTHMLSLIRGTQAAIFGHALPLLCLSAVLYGAVLILRPVAAVLHPNEQERSRVEELARRYGRNSISYFALDIQKTYFFSASGQSAISYVLEGNVAVVAGDPIGPEEELDEVIQQFVQFCEEQDWRIVFWQVLDSTVERYRAAGMHTLKIGEDAVISTRDFKLSGKAMANVRTSAKRAEKDGVRVIFSHGQVQDSHLLSQMEHISRAWLAAKGGAEMGFSMGHFTTHGDPGQIYAIAMDESNTVHGFVTFIPIYGRGGWGLDLMRRAELCAPGTMELLLARSIEYLRECGAEVVSLGLAPLSNANDDDENFLESSIDFLTKRFVDPRKSQSLFNFKKKFQPCWESRYLVYSSRLDLPTIGLAVYRAHLRNTSLLVALYRSFQSWQETYKTTHKKVTDAARIVGQRVTGELS